MPGLSSHTSSPILHILDPEEMGNTDDLDQGLKMSLMANSLSFTAPSTAFSTACNSPSPTPSDSAPRKRRRFTRYPVRGPESADDSRFLGITFSFATPAQSSSEYLRVIRAATPFNSGTNDRQVPSPSQMRPTTPEVDASFVESEFESELDGTELDETTDLESYEDTKSFAKRQPISRPPSGPRKQKQCACCGCTSTPLWRDMGKNQPLCNACGIRWKKYGVVCDVCQYVPCKQERESKLCKRCTAPLPPAPKRIRAASPQTVPKKSSTSSIVAM